MPDMQKNNGYDIIGNGEVGMGNTTTAAACVMAALNISDPEIAVGLGAGLTEEAFARKKTGHCRRFEKAPARRERCGGYSQQGGRIGSCSDDGTVYRRGLS